MRCQGRSVGAYKLRRCDLFAKASCKKRAFSQQKLLVGAQVYELESRPGTSAALDSPC